MKKTLKILQVLIVIELFAIFTIRTLFSENIDKSYHHTINSIVNVSFAIFIVLFCVSFYLNRRR